MQINRNFMNSVVLTFEQIWKDLGSLSLGSYQREIDIALLYLRLYAPTAAVISLGKNTHKIYDSTKTLVQIYQSPEWRENTRQAAECAATILHLGVSYASPLGGALLSSGTLLGRQVYHLGNHLSKKEWGHFNKELLETMVTTIHLFAIFSGSPALISLSIVFRALSELKESYSYYRAEKWPEALASLALGITRLYSARPYASEAWRQYSRKSLTQQDADKIFRRLGALQASLAEKKQTQSHSLSLQATSAQTISEPISVRQVLEEEGFSNVIEDLSLDRFSQSRLSGLDFSGVQFKECSFSNATIKDSTFSHCSFIDCQFDSIAVIECTFDSVQIKNTNFSLCKFDQDHLIKANIESSFFTNCIFKDVVFFHNAIEKTTFDRSSLQGTYFNDSRINEVTWTSCKLNESVFLGVRAKNSSMKRCDLTDAVLCEAESTLKLGLTNLRKITKPVVSISWNFINEGPYAKIICQKLKENGIVPLKFHVIPVETNLLEIEKEVYAARASLEGVQILSANCFGEKLLLSAAPGSQLGKIYKRAGLIANFAHAHLLPGGDDIEPALYGKNVPLIDEITIESRLSLKAAIYRAQPNTKFPQSAFEEGKYAKSLLELSILSHANRKGQRVLGICRGAQMVNVFNNGTLRQYVVGQTGMQALQSTPLVSSRAEELRNDLFGPAEIHAVSMHHQCAEQIGTGLHVLYESKEGVPKVLVHENGRVIGIQFHPELYDSPETIKDLNFLKSAPYFRRLFQKLGAVNQSEARS